MKCYFPLKINYHRLKQQFYLDKHGASHITEESDRIPHCFCHPLVTVALLCRWQSQLKPQATFQAGFCNSVCDKANVSINLSCIQGAYDKSTTQTAKCKSNL